MIGFLLRKTLYDFWDNLFRLVLINMGFFALTAVPVFLPQLAGKFTDSLSLKILLSAIGIFICSVYLAAASHSLKAVSDYGSFGFGDFFRNLKIAWPAGLVMGCFIFVLFLIATVVIPYYISFESIIGLVFTMIMFWTTVFFLLSFQFFFTVHARLNTNIIKAIKKCMIISLDNSAFALFLLVHNVAAIVLLAWVSPVLPLLFPGPAIVILYLDEALRLRLLKYDWLEANPGANRRKIPWDAILIEEREKTGTRTFRNFIFPWKD
jgi:hypothetical protein